MEFSGTTKAGKRFSLNLTPIIGGIAFGLWMHSWLAGIAFATLLAEVAASRKA